MVDRPVISTLIDSTPITNTSRIITSTDLHSEARHLDSIQMVLFDRIMAQYVYVYPDRLCQEAHSDTQTSCTQISDLSFRIFGRIEKEVGRGQIMVVNRG